MSSYSRPEKNTVAVQVRHSRRRVIIEQSYSDPKMMSFTTSQPHCIWQHRVGSTDEKCKQIMMDGEILGQSIGTCTLNDAIYFRKVSSHDSIAAKNTLTQVFFYMFFTLSLPTVCFTTRPTALYKTTPPPLPHLLKCTDMSTEHRLNLSPISEL